MSKPDSTRLRELLNYNPATGVFTWRVKPNRRIAIGSEAGCLDPAGYVRIRVDGKQTHAHRIAWCYVYGSWPVGDVDHINGQRTENHIANLRDVSRTVNNQNQRAARGSNPYLGVSRMKKRWGAWITNARKSQYLGTFDTPEEAHAAYLAAKRKLHEGCAI